MFHPNKIRAYLLMLILVLPILSLAILSGCSGELDAKNIFSNSADEELTQEFQEKNLTQANLQSATIIPVDEYSSNPGIGWQYVGGDYPITYPAETVAYAPRAEISWRVLNPAEGVYDWSKLDQHLDYVVSQGKQFSFRVYTMRGEIYGGHQLPQWVLDKGAVIFEDGEPDFSNCVYQQEWGTFVEQLIQRYDGNPNIAFIDISGYGDFNEWSWINQTVWDDTWANAYSNQTASRDTMIEMDSFARRILADMFIGGSYDTHRCRMADGSVEKMSYSYQGFEQTQLVMPYAGTIQSFQYIHSQDPFVGFRHDCLGRDSSNEIVADHRLGPEIDEIWPVAPVVFETCQPNSFSLANSEYLLAEAHASLVHDVNIDLATEDILQLVEPIGYKYQLLDFKYSDNLKPGELFKVMMDWQNLGYAPSYPRMGQDFELHLYLLDDLGHTILDLVAPTDISQWMPAAALGETPLTYTVELEGLIPDELETTIEYHFDVQIIDTRTGNPIWLPFTMAN